jgi:hypothetical protein
MGGAGRKWHQRLGQRHDRGSREPRDVAWQASPGGSNGDRHHLGSVAIVEGGQCGTVGATTVIATAASHTGEAGSGCDHVEEGYSTTGAIDATQRKRAGAVVLCEREMCPWAISKYFGD